MIKRRRFTAEFKAQVVLEMLTEQKSAAQASREYGIKDSVLSRWKQEFIERSPMLFEQGRDQQDDREERIAELERMVGRLATELEMVRAQRGLCGPACGCRAAGERVPFAAHGACSHTTAQASRARGVRARAR